MILTIRDETASGSITNELTLDVLSETITVRELIRSRVYQEVQDFNLRQRTGDVGFKGLVTPTDAEQALDGMRLRQPREVDWKGSSKRPVTASNATVSSSSSTTARPKNWTKPSPCGTTRR